MNNTTLISSTFTIGKDLVVNRLGYGAMSLSGQPGNFGAYPDWEGGKELLRRAIELGIRQKLTARVLMRKLLPMLYIPILKI